MNILKTGKVGLEAHEGKGGDRVSDRMTLGTIAEGWQVAYG